MPTLPYLYPSTLPYGSRAVTFNFQAGGTGYTILESFELSNPSFEISRQNELGVPNGFGLLREPQTANATAQLAGSSTTYIKTGDTSFITVRGTATTFVVTQASDPEENRGIKKQTLSLREEI